MVIESPEQSEISPIRHAISAGLLQSKVNGCAEGQECPFETLNYEIIYSKIIAYIMPARRRLHCCHRDASGSNRLDLGGFSSRS